jgi:hypothetical protein
MTVIWTCVRDPTAVKKATSTLVAATVLGEELMLC